MRNHFLNLLLFSVLSIVSLSGAWAEGFQAEPTIACDFMAEEGLRTRGGYRGGGDSHRCFSQRRSLMSGGQINNSIRFVAQGNAEKVTQLTLELQVNSRTAVQRAHRQLVDHAKLLMMNALGAEMPEEVEAAILSATKGVWEVGGSRVTLERIVLSSPAYELRFRIQ